MNEVIAKITALQQANAQQSQPVATPLTIAENMTFAGNTGNELEKYQKKLDALEAELSSLTKQRLDYLEKLQQQHFDIQVVEDFFFLLDILQIF